MDIREPWLAPEPPDPPDAHYKECLESGQVLIDWAQCICRELYTDGLYAKADDDYATLRDEGRL
jgi:hypothetical protein